MTALRHLSSDLRSAAWSLARQPSLLVVACLSIAIGAGLNMSVFTALRRVLFSSVVTAAAPERLVRISPGISFQNYLDLRRDTLPIDLAAMQMSTLTVRSAASTRTVTGHVVSDTFFDVVGVPPLRGRTFSGQDDNRDVAVITESFWRELGSDPMLIGSAIQINGWTYDVIGVMPRGFASTAIATGSVYVRISARVANALDNRRAAQFDLFGRLHDSVSDVQALAALRIAAARVEASHPDVNGGFAQGLSSASMDGFSFLRQLPAGRIALAAAALLYGLVGLVLIAACTNVAGLLISRADERRHELSVRVALGATRARLMQQLLAESLIVSSIGCGAAAALWIATAAWLQQRVAAATGTEIALLSDSLPLVYCVLLVAGVTVLCGLAPSLGVVRAAQTESLQARRSGRVVRGARLHRVVVTTQMAICCVLLVGAALLLRNLVVLYSVDRGYPAAQLAEVTIRVPTSVKAASMPSVVDAVGALPGVRAISWGSPLGPPFPERWRFSNAGDRDAVSVDVRGVGPAFFDALRVPLVRGRDLSVQDLDAKQPQPIVVNEAFVRRYVSQSPDLSPIGQQLVRAANDESGRRAQLLEIVGVARDNLARTIGDGVVPVAYIPQRMPSLLVRTESDSRSMLKTIEATVERIEPAGTIVIATSMEDSLAGALAPLRVATLTLGGLGVVGSLLAMTGLFAIARRSAARRRFELAVRVAIGAPRRSIVGLLLRDTARITALGCAAGTVVALLIARAVSAMTTQRVTDPVAVGLAILCVFVIGLVSSLQPAVRAGRTDPIDVLRSE